MFAMHTIHGKDITAFSAVPDEGEVILMPGTQLRAKCESLNFAERLMILYVEDIRVDPWRPNHFLERVFFA